MAVARRSMQQMLGNARVDAALYWRLIGARLRAQMQYRASFVLMSVITGFGIALEFVALIFLFDRFGSVAGWEIGQIAFLYALASICFGLAEMVGAGFDTFSASIRRGEFDQVLLRPAGLFTQVLAADFQLRRLGRITQGVGALVFALVWTPVDWTFGKLIFLPLVILSGTAMFFALFVLGATLCFWTVESIELINTLTDGGTELTSYPLPIFHELMQRFFIYIVPLAFLSYFPSLYLLDRPEADDWPVWLPFLTPVAALALVLGARVAWSFGVRHYRSTGS